MYSAPTITSEDLEALYVREGLTQDRTAERLGVSRTVVRYWLKRHGIASRRRGGSKISGSEPLRERRLCAAEECGNEFFTYPSLDQRYCSLSCRSRTHAKYGKDHPNWQGGLTDLALQIRRSICGIAWRSAVFARDGYACIECGATGSLHAHHIVALSALLRLHEVESLEQALTCEELWDVDNGQALCPSCHKETDNYLWKAKV